MLNKFTDENLLNRTIQKEQILKLGVLEVFFLECSFKVIAWEISQN